MCFRVSQFFLICFRFLVASFVSFFSTMSPVVRQSRHPYWAGLAGSQSKRLCPSPPLLISIMVSIFTALDPAEHQYWLIVGSLGINFKIDPPLSQKLWSVNTGHRVERHHVNSRPRFDISMGLPISPRKGSPIPRTSRFQARLPHASRLAD